MNTTTLKFKRVRAGWYETGNDIEGAYVISSDNPGSWHIAQWVYLETDTTRWLELVTFESAGTFAYAKEIANHNARLN
jgi:hypothetical protein